MTLHAVCSLRMLPARGQVACLRAMVWAREGSEHCVTASVCTKGVKNKQAELVNNAHLQAGSLRPGRQEVQMHKPLLDSILSQDCRCPPGLSMTRISSIVYLRKQQPPTLNELTRVWESLAAPAAGAHPARLHAQTVPERAGRIKRRPHVQVHRHGRTGHGRRVVEVYYVPGPAVDCFRA